MKKLLFLFLMLALLRTSFAQDQHLVDSLKSRLKEHQAARKEMGALSYSLMDTTAANILYQLSRAYWGNNPDSAMALAEQALTLSEQIEYKKGIAKAYYSMGIIHSDWGEFPEAIQLQEKTLQIFKEIDNQPGVADAYNEIGQCHYYMGNYPEALKNLLASVKINQEYKKVKAIAGTYTNIGNVYVANGNNREALKYHLLSLDAFKEIGYKRGIGAAYNNIGTLYYKQEKFADALINYEASISIKEELGDKRGIANACVNVATIYAEQGNGAEALKNIHKAIGLYEEIGDKNGLSSTYLVMGKTFEKQGRFNEGKASIQKGLAMALETGNKNVIKDGYSMLASISARLNDFKSAYENEMLYKQAYDSVFNAENDKRLAQQQMQFDFDKKAQSDSLKFVKEKEIDAIRLQKQKGFTYGGFTGVAITVILLFSVYRSYKKQRIANQKLKEAQEQLIKSEKMAAFGAMASRMSHEILNPLNFVNNFSNLSQETVNDVINSTSEEEKRQSAEELISNLQRINDHGRRAAGIVMQLQEHSNKGTVQEFFETTK